MLFVKEDDGLIYAECEECNRILKLKKHQLTFKEEKSIYNIPGGLCCFCGHTSDVVNNVPKSDRDTSKTISRNTVLSVPTSREQIPGDLIASRAIINAPYGNIPKCPTCGSLNVERISMGSKIVGGAMFGVFSSSIRNSYKCKNCNYKW